MPTAKPKKKKKTSAKKSTKRTTKKRTAKGKTGRKSRNPMERLREQIKDVRMAMLSTLRGGRIVTRPMSAQTMSPTGTISFLTSVDSDKVKEIRRNPSVNLTFSDPGSESYISVTGTAKVTNDRAQIREFWNPFHKAWFKGPDDPTIRIIEVEPESAEYWVTRGGKIVSLISMLASAITGKDMEAGENETLTL